MSRKRGMRTKNFTCSVPPPPEISQSSDTLTIVQGSAAFQWKSTTLSLDAQQRIKTHIKGKKTLSQPNLQLNIYNCLINELKHARIMERRKMKCQVLSRKTRGNSQARCTFKSQDQHDKPHNGQKSRYC